MAEENGSFLGRGWAFPPAFDRHSGETAMAEDETDIRQSLQILLSTQVGERILQPRYGCDLRRYVFEPLDATLKTYLFELVRDAILYFEPRIVAESIELETDALEGRLDIIVHYHIPSTNTRNNLVYPFYLDQAAGRAP